MAISHVCPRCGFDLARSRALIEPHYHLPVVRCPRCRTVQVRRKHPLLSYYRRLRRMIGIFQNLIVKSAVIYAVSAALYILMRGLDPQWRSMLFLYENINFNNPDEVYDFFIREVAPFISWVCTAIAGGAVIGGFFHHWKRKIAWGCWLLFLILLVSDDAIYDITLGSYEYVFAIKQPHFWYTGWLSWTTNVQAAILTFLVSLLGAPFGWMLIRAGENRRKRKFRKRRIKRRRAQREG